MTPAFSETPQAEWKVCVKNTFVDVETAVTPCLIQRFPTDPEEYLHSCEPEGVSLQVSDEVEPLVDMPTSPCHLIAAEFSDGMEDLQDYPEVSHKHCVMELKTLVDEGEETHTESHIQLCVKFTFLEFKEVTPVKIQRVISGPAVLTSGGIPAEEHACVDRLTKSLPLDPPSVMSSGDVGDAKESEASDTEAHSDTTYAFCDTPYPQVACDGFGMPNFTLPNPTGSIAISHLCMPPPLVSVSAHHWGNSTSALYDPSEAIAHSLAEPQGEMQDRQHSPDLVDTQYVKSPGEGPPEVPSVADQPELESELPPETQDLDLCKLIGADGQVRNLLARAADDSTLSVQEAAPSGDTRRTVMLKNLPGNLKRDHLRKLLDKKGCSNYDFVYLPRDMRKPGNPAGLGYAFVDFVTHDDAKKSWDKLHGFNAWAELGTGFTSTKACDVRWGDRKRQGLDQQIKYFQNSSLMHESVPDECRPAIYESGVRKAFPPATRRIRPPRITYAE
jgi:hypothetical protein